MSEPRLALARTGPWSSTKASSIAIRRRRRAVRDLGALEVGAGASDEIDGRYEGRSYRATLAAAYAFGIASNHPFIDGNKRVAFLAMVDFPAPERDRLRCRRRRQPSVIIRDLAAGSVDEGGLTRWIRDNLPGDG